MSARKVELTWTPQTRQPVVLSGGQVVARGPGRMVLALGSGPALVCSSRPRDIATRSDNLNPAPDPRTVPAPLVLFCLSDGASPIRAAIADGVQRGMQRLLGGMPCFAPGTGIATPDGARAVETLGPGDMVLTRDNGVQPVLWRGESLLDPALFGPVAGLGPIVILPDALGPGQPARPLTLSANHRVLIAENASALHFEEREVLAAARDLVPLGRAEWQAPRKIAWQHLLLASHEVILAEGGWCESLQPLPVVLAGCAPDARAALAGLVPDAAQASRTGPYAAARIMLRPEEAALLAHGRGIAVTQAR